MPNIPQMASVWEELGGAWVKSTKGTAHARARRVHDRCTQHPRTRSADRRSTRDDGRPADRAPVIVRPCRKERVVSTTAVRADPPRRARRSRSRRSRARRASSRSSPGRSASRSRSSCSRSSTRSRSGRRVILVGDGASGSRVAVLVAATLVDRRASTCSQRWRSPLKFLIPGTVFLLAFQVIPILYTINVAFTNYSTGHILVEGRGDRGDQAELARAAGERQVVHDGAGARRGRQPRARSSSTRTRARRTSARRKG